jgi:hypothetical protein
MLSNKLLLTITANVPDQNTALYSRKLLVSFQYRSCTARDAKSVILT